LGLLLVAAAIDAKVAVAARPIVLFLLFCDAPHTVCVQPNAGHAGGFGRGAGDQQNEAAVNQQLGALCA